MNKNKFNKIVLLIFALSVAFLCGCASTAPPSHSTQIFALDTVIDITAYGEHGQEAITAASREIYRLEKLLSVTDESSEIYKLNHSKGKEITVSADTYRLIEISTLAANSTKGMFDPTIYPVLKLWGFTQGEYTVPSDGEIKTSLNDVNYKNITLNDGKVSLQEGTELDLGGIAKGYIADKAADAMQETGCTSGLISLGGNVRTIGTKPSGDIWNIGIKNPESNDYFATLSAENSSVITSGAYQRNFTADGVTYHHIIDPHTGYPSDSDAVSVTIIGKDGALCDAYSTAIFASGTGQAEALQTTAEFEYVILTKDNTIYVSDGLKNNFSLTDENSPLTVIYK